ncbi:DUF6950 family protein [Paracoccus sp. KR1-242]
MARAVSPDQVMAEVERVMSRPFDWGPCDCCSAACTVFAGLWGFDPMAPVRGYRGAFGAKRMLARYGGLGALADDLAARAGLVPGHAVGGLALGDIGPGSGSLLICVAPGIWAGKSMDGFAILRSAEKGWHA